MQAAGTFDFIIVGGGTAGCVLANRLSADAGQSVLLLEAGGRDNWIWLHIPAGYLYCIGNPRTDWCYRTEPEAGLNGRSIAYARGRVLGGSSSINAMLYLRGQAADYDGWARSTGDPGWAWKNVLPLFCRTEDSWRGTGEFHGACASKGAAPGHEWRVEKQRLSWPILDAFARAAVECGIPPIDDFNCGDNEGVCRFEVNQRAGIRWSASKAFLRPVRGRRNLTILTGCQVTRLRLKGRQCEGVEFMRDGTACFAQSHRSTVLAAGAIGSPQLLQLSGIGPGELSTRLGIPVVKDLPGVGANLQDHLQLRMAFRVSHVTTLNTLMNSFWGRLKIGIEYALFRSGPLSMAPSQLGAFARSDPGEATANLEYHIQPLSLDRFGAPLHPFDAFTASVADLRPTSRGWVRITSPDPQVHPAIAPCYLSTDRDRHVAIQALRLTRRIVTSSESMKQFAPREFMPGPDHCTDEALLRAAGDIGTTIFHPVGTCKMGPVSDPGAVVTPHLSVHGIERLHVIDASVMPAITSGNTNSPTLMIAERGAELLLKQ